MEFVGIFSTLDIIL